MTCAILLLPLCFLSPAHAAEPVTAKVTGQHVNLRAKPESTSEVVGQVSDGDVLSVKSIQAEWVEVVAPESVELWVHQDFVADGRSAVSKLNVRAGPGVNYNVVGNLDKGEALTVKGTFGEWVRIAPFPAASLWVSKDFVQLNLPVRKTPPPVSVVAATNRPPLPPAAADVSPTSTVQAAQDIAPPPPSDLVLIPLAGQGKLVEREGELKPAPYAVNRPSPFRLAQRVGTRMDTVCYLRGNTQQLQSLMGWRLSVRGREYWVQGVNEAIVVVERIEKRPIPTTP
ncbi:MAG: SH3 domain-containing protein [bacterium]